MASELRNIVRALCLLAVAHASGCMTQGATETARTAAAEPAAMRKDEPGDLAATRDATAAEPTSPGNNAAVGDEAAVGSSAAAISAILAERRRGDFPEIELGDVWFTITEQTRIDSDARADYERALGLLRQSRVDEGIALLESVTATTPEATAPWIDLGIAYGQAGNLDGAEEALTAAGLLSPGNPIVHNELGILYRRTGRFAEARASYEQALALFGEFHYARRNLAVLCDLYLADSACALANYRAYLASVGTDAEVEIWVADLENRAANRGGL